MQLITASLAANAVEEVLRPAEMMKSSYSIPLVSSGNPSLSRITVTGISGDIPCDFIYNRIVRMKSVSIKMLLGKFGFLMSNSRMDCVGT